MNRTIIAALFISSQLSYGQQSSSPYAISNVEASGLFQGRNKTGDNVMKCYRFSRPCSSDVTKAMIVGGQCGNDPPLVLQEIHDNDNTTCLNRSASLQDSINLYLLLQMPNDWHDFMKYSKNYFQSDSLKNSEGWKVSLEGLTSSDSTKLKTYGVFEGSFEGSLWFDGKKCKICQ